MTGEELAKLGELRAHFAKDAVPGSAAERFLCDANLCRYLRARQWDVAKAIHMLQGALEWRAKSGVDEIRFEHVKAESVTGKIQRLPHLDKHGRPILVLRPGARQRRLGEQHIFVHNALLVFSGRENTKDPAQQSALALPFRHSSFLTVFFFVVSFLQWPSWRGTWKPPCVPCRPPTSPAARTWIWRRSR